MVDRDRGDRGALKERVGEGRVARARVWSPAGGLGGLTLGLLIALLGAVGILVPGGGEAEEELGLKWLFALRGPVPSPDGVVVVAIDERSARELGLPESPRTWPRRLHAELVRRLVRSDARAIAFDLTFDTPSAEPADDLAFAAAIAAAGNVVLVESVRREVVPLQTSPPGRVDAAVIQSSTPPTALLRESAIGRAPFLLPKSARVDFYWPFHDDAGGEPALPVLVLQVLAREELRRYAEQGAQADPALGAMLQELVPSVAEAPHREPVSLRLRLVDQPSLQFRFPGVAEASRTGRAAEPDPLVRSVLSAYVSSAVAYLNFYGPVRTVTTVSYVDALRAARAGADGDAQGDPRFRGKAVFVGFAPETPGGQDRLRDDYRTVYSLDNGLNLSGVEIAATAFANLRDGSTLRPLPMPGQLALVAAFGLMLGMLCRVLRPLPAAFGVVGVAVLWLAFVAERFIDAALWLPSVVPVGVQASVALFAGVWLRYRDMRREREMVKRAFAHFLPRVVVDEFVAEPDALKRSSRVVYGACVSTDVERYTTLSERLEPGALGTLMNEYYAQVFVPVERRRGVVVDLVGDATMSVWVGTSSKLQARRDACHAALEMSAVVTRFNQSHGSQLALPTRFGLHAGDLLFGVVGASGHYEYRAVGDIVNTASRIQGLNKTLGTRILASEATVAGLDDVVTRRVGSFRLVGKSQAVPVVELIGQRRAVGGEVEAFCASFHEALRSFAERRWAEAGERFAVLLETHPGDVPSRFYADACARLVAAPPGDDWEPVIRVDTK